MNKIDYSEKFEIELGPNLFKSFPLKVVFDQETLEALRWSVNLRLIAVSDEERLKIRHIPIKLHHSKEEMLLQIAELYIKKYLDAGEILTTSDLFLTTTWVNIYKAGDYEPFHSHHGLISGSLYLHVPPQIGAEAPTTGSTLTEGTDGRLYFGYDSFSLQSLRTGGDRVITPREGDMYMFPSWLMHGVYPFKGEGERIGISFNIDRKIKNL